MVFKSNLTAQAHWAKQEYIGQLGGKQSLMVHAQVPQIDIAFSNVLFSTRPPKVDSE